MNLTKIYIDSFQKEYLQEPYNLYIETYKNKILPVFLNVEEEAHNIAKNCFKDMGKHINPDTCDPADLADRAWEKGLDYYQGMILMRYNSQLMWISTLYQFWEQQVRCFIFEEVSRNFRRVNFKSFCNSGIKDIRKQFQRFGIDINELNSWPDINELRLLTNVIKHGDGNAAAELEKMKPEYFRNNFDDSLIKFYGTSLNYKTINVLDSDFYRFCNDLILFWDELALK